jgi:hypothetical protein
MKLNKSIALWFGKSTNSFYLYDLTTCQGWGLYGCEDDLSELLNSLKQSLYLLEPGDTAKGRPLFTHARSLVTLPPARIKKYTNDVGHVILDMPEWNLEELLIIARHEGLDTEMVEKNFLEFGGNIWDTLQPPWK